MELFDNLKERITKTTKVAIRKSNDLVEVTKLKMAVSDLETEINGMMRHIGEVLYEAYKTGNESYGALEEECELIDAKYAQIADLTERMANIKNAKTCPNCKKEMEKTAQFCSACGEKF